MQEEWSKSGARVEDNRCLVYRLILSIQASTTSHKPKQVALTLEFSDFTATSHPTHRYHQPSLVIPASREPHSSSRSRFVLSTCAYIMSLSDDANTSRTRLKNPTSSAIQSSHVTVLTVLHASSPKYRECKTNWKGLSAKHTTPA